MISEQQTPDEWLWFVDQVKPVNSYLEIGSYNGHSLVAVVSSRLMQPGGIIRSIDLGNHGTADRLKQICDSITESGTFNAQCFIGDSRDPNAVYWASRWAVYDVVFIDGDHSYEGVKSDWEQYGPMGKIVAFHDVVSKHEPGPVKLWNEVKNGPFRTAEKVADQLHQIYAIGQQGIGILWR